MAGDGTFPDDYDRVCEAEAGEVGFVDVGENGAQALVLGDLPSRTCYLAEHRVFLRCIGAESDAGLTAAAEAVLADSATVWEECGRWVTDGPAVLMDSTDAGAEVNVPYPDGGDLPEQAPVPLPDRRWRVRGVFNVQPDAVNWFSLVQLVPADA